MLFSAYVVVNNICEFVCFVLKRCDTVEMVKYEFMTSIS